MLTCRLPVPQAKAFVDCREITTAVVNKVNGLCCSHFGDGHLQVERFREADDPDIRRLEAANPLPYTPRFRGAPWFAGVAPGSHIGLPGFRTLATPWLTHCFMLDRRLASMGAFPPTTRPFTTGLTSLRHF